VLTRASRIVADQFPFVHQRHRGESCLLMPHRNVGSRYRRCRGARVPAVVLIAWTVSLISCEHGSSTPVNSIDLLAELPHAERRAVGAPDQSIRADVVRSADEVLPALVMDAPSRVIYQVRMPTRARFVSKVTLVATPQGVGAVTARLGLSTNRRYEEIFRLSLTQGPDQSSRWIPVNVDLSEYSGWHWSVFYRPSRWTWNLILNADATPGGSLAWARPLVEMY
jgi:hypothetical protein